jgi:hypothetical protein
MISWPFTFNAALDARVTDGQVAVDAAPPYAGAVTRVFVHNLSGDGLNVRRAVLAHPVGTMIYLQDRADASIYAALLMTARPIENKGYLEIPVTCTEGNPEGLTAGPIEAFFLPAAPALAVVRAAVRAATDPVLVTLATAKTHLRITDSDHDADITQKMASASATIRDYLKGQNDPTWDDMTAPPWVAAAVLVLLAHQYEHRGDQFGPSNDNDDRVWSAIENLLRRSRDPALA